MRTALLFSLSWACTGSVTPEVAAPAGIVYPTAPRDDDAVDVYFGTEVRDPFEPLEDPDAEATKRWVTEQNALTESFLSSVPERAAIGARLTALWNHERTSVPKVTAGRYLYEHNDGLQNQNQLLIQESLSGEPRVLLDANTLSADGTVPLTEWSLSPDGRTLAYAVSDGGSDWRVVRVRSVETGRDLADELSWVKFSDLSFREDSAGFYYSRYPEPKADDPQGALAYQRVYYHAIGALQSEDVLVLSSDDNPKWGFDVEETDDGLHLVAHVREGSAKKSRVWVRDAKDAAAPWVKVLDAFDAMYTVVSMEGDKLLVFTDNGAPKGRLVEISLDNPAPSAWKERIPEGTDQLESVTRAGDSLFALYLRDARSAVRRFGLDGSDRGEIALPGIGTARGFSGRAGDTETFYSFTSFTEPTSIYRYDLATGQSTVFWGTKLSFDSSSYVTEQTFYPSKDGTKIPMFLVHKRDLPLDGSHPTLLYGYGGFKISQTPNFSVPIAVWLEMGGVYAVANLRGGGEYGRQWHEAGTKQQKQNVFDDFIAAAEHLVSSGVTKPEKLAIHGRSNGGLLVGAVMLQRPDLFGAAIPGVGVLDMLKYHTWTIGWGWASDYGTSEESEEMFRALLAYSPVHNARPASYPPTLILTADHDDRVVPAHSFKFAAALQEAQQGKSPVLARIETRAGHGAGKSVAMQIDERADMYTFLVDALDMDVLMFH